MQGVVIWVTGLPASGKSTFAQRAADRLTGLGKCVCRLDSDELRGALFPGLGYDDASRDAFYEALAQAAALLARQGLCVLVAATAHRTRWRGRARQLAPRFVEVWIDVPAGQCAERDPKGLWRAATTGSAPELPGAGVAYEPPVSPDVIAHGGFDHAALADLSALVVEVTHAGARVA
jgi:adenylylsulfate kinase